MPPFLEYRRNENEKSTILPDEERKMCAMHALMNANQIIENGGEAKIKSVKLPQILDQEGNPLYKKLLENKTIVGVCKACSKMLEVYEINKDLGLNFL